MKRIIKINKDYNFLEDFINSIPTIFEEKGEYIYKERNQIKIFEVKDNFVCVKRFKIPIVINRFIYGYFRKSKARRAFENSDKMIDKGFDSPEPIAYIEEYKCGLFSESYYICEYSKYPNMFRDFENLDDISDYKDVIAFTGRYIAKMHNANVYHKDLSIGNILFNKNNRKINLTIIDTNRMSFGKVGIKKGYKGLERLRGNDKFIKILAYSYADERGLERKKSYEIVHKLIDKSVLYFNKKSKRKEKKNI